MQDRRRFTSRKNLGDNVPAALGPGRSRVVAARLPASLADELDAEAARAGVTRADIIRWCLERGLPESRRVAPYDAMVCPTSGSSGPPAADPVR